MLTIKGQRGGWNAKYLNPRPTSSTAVRLAIVFSFDASKFVKRSEIILVRNPRQSNSAPRTPKITTLKIFKIFSKFRPGKKFDFEKCLKC